MIPVLLNKSHLMNRVSKKIVTLDDIYKALPIQNLQSNLQPLEQQSIKLAKRKCEQLEPIKWFEEQSKRVFSSWATLFRNGLDKAEEGLNLENGRDASLLQMNKERMSNIFKKCRDDLDRREKETLLAMDDMTPEEQEGALIFWQLAQSFFSLMMDYISSAFKFISEKIKNGYTILKDS